MKKSFQNFKSVICTIKDQQDSDIKYADQVGEAMGVDYHPYNNSLLVNALIKVVSGWFDNSDVAFQEISKFIFDFEFGECKDCEHITISSLWYDLTGERFVSPNEIREQWRKSIEESMEDQLNEKSKKRFVAEVPPNHDKSSRSCTCFLENNLCKCEPD